MSLDLSLFPEKISSMAYRMSALCTSSPAFVLGGMVSVISGVLGRSRCVGVRQGWTEPPGLYTVIVGAPGSSKTQVSDKLTHILTTIDKGLNLSYRKDFEAFERDTLSVNSANYRNRGQEMSVGIEHLAPSKPLQVQTRCDDTTIEKLAQILESNPIGLLLYRNELGGLFGGFDKYRPKGSASDESFFCNAYDGQSLRTQRKDGTDCFVDEYSLSLYGNCTPVQAAQLVRSHNAGGFAHRFLYIMDETDRFAPLYSEVSDACVFEWNDFVNSIYYHRGSLPPLMVTGDVRSVFSEAHAKYRQRASSGIETLLAQYSSKMFGRLVRLSGAFQSFLDLSSNEISMDAVRAALALSDFSYDCFQQILLGEYKQQDSYSDPISIAEGKIKNYVPKVSGCSRHDIFSAVRGSTENKKKALDLLLGTGQIKEVNGGFYLPENLPKNAADDLAFKIGPYPKAKSSSSLFSVLARFGSVMEASRGQYTAICPAHDDKKNSLSISLNEDKILLYCHAGCSVESVLSTASLSIADLFLSNHGQKQVPASIKAIYSYSHNGVEQYQVVRMEPKSFRQRHKEDGKWVWNMDGVDRIPYRIDEIANSSQVIIVEGEKDVDTLSGLGFVATTFAGGASAWKSDYARFFIGKQVLVIPDNDPSGVLYAESIVKDIPSASVLCLKDIDTGHPFPAKGDITDFVEILSTSGGAETAIRSFLSGLFSDAFGEIPF